MNIQNLNEDLAKSIKNLALTKQLNILIGSGCSTPAIPLMGAYSKYKENANDYLLRRVASVSKLLLCEPHKNNKSSTTEIGKKTEKTAKSYLQFIESVINLLTISNSRQIPKAVNIFTTNYDLFIESAINELYRYKRIVFNDGSNGYFHRILDSTNYNRVVAYKGLNDNYISEIPSVNLIKSHGSVNWSVFGEKVIVSDRVVANPMVVAPSGLEAQDTFLNNYFHDMLRVFQLELDKPQSILLVIGFSFQDNHIAKMFRRALQNPELLVYVFSYSNDITSIQKNIGIEGVPSNLKIVKPIDIIESSTKEDSDIEECKFVLNDLTSVLSINLERENE